MPILKPKKWVEATGADLTALARRVHLTRRSLLRYLKGDRPWPHNVAVYFKRISGGALSDESFVFSPTGRKSSHTRGKANETVRSVSRG